MRFEAAVADENGRRLTEWKPLELVQTGPLVYDLPSPWSSGLFTVPRGGVKVTTVLLQDAGGGLLDEARYISGRRGWRFWSPVRVDFLVLTLHLRLVLS